MNLIRTLSDILDKNQKDHDKTEDYPILVDLMKKRNFSNDRVNSVHYRRDLDSLG